MFQLGPSLCKEEEETPKSKNIAKGYQVIHAETSPSFLSHLSPLLHPVLSKEYLND